MRGRRYRLTVLADEDIASILAHTRREFGDRQLRTYAALIDKAAEMVGRAPLRVNSKSREDLGIGVRSFHVEIAARRRGAAAHVIYYVPAILEDGLPGSTILRVLWEGMDPWSLIAASVEEPS